jgi:hypothetical protein
MNQVLAFAPAISRMMVRMWLQSIVVMSLAMILSFHSALRGETAKLRVGSKMWIFSRVDRFRMSI